jgi:acetyl/propionyl-CoA carboxylase alpha subunit
LTDAAVTIARTIGYVGAGTAEFLVDGSGDRARIYFLELNMRLQVEHPITEAVTGVDLVALQLRVASGEPLPFSQSDIRTAGHAFEARVYAEDARTFLPQAGRLLRYREPVGPGVRIDGGVIEGHQVTVHYDPLMAKVIAHAASRGEARDRLLAALRRFEILGVRHNVGLLTALVTHPRVAAGATDTTFIERERLTLTQPPSDELLDLAAAVAAVAALGPSPPPDSTATAAEDPWDRLSAFGIDA